MPARSSFQLWSHAAPQPCGQRPFHCHHDVHIIFQAKLCARSERRVDSFLLSLLPQRCTEDNEECACKSSRVSTLFVVCCNEARELDTWRSSCKGLKVIGSSLDGRSGFVTQLLRTVVGFAWWIFCSEQDSASCFFSQWKSIWLFKLGSSSNTFWSIADYPPTIFSNNRTFLAEMQLRCVVFAV